MIAQTPEPPYYAVIFTNNRTEIDAGYSAMAQRMVELAEQRPGYLGLESFRQPDGQGVTISYWASLEDIAAWRVDLEHQVAQQLGREQWYEAYALRVAKVERAYFFERSPVEEKAGPGQTGQRE